MGIDMRQWGQQFLKPDDVKDKPRKEQIAVINPPAENAKYPKPTAVFESGKLVQLNKTSVGALMREFGTDSDDWIGRFVECRYMRDLIDGKETEWINVEPIDAITPGQRRKLDPEPKAGGGRSDMDDDIPFSPEWR